METANKTPHPTDKEPHSHEYNPNPLMLAVAGIERLFIYVKPVAIVLLIASLASFTLNLLSTGSSSPNSELESSAPIAPEITPSLAGLDATLIATLATITLMLLFGMAVLAILIAGVVDYSAATTAQGRKAKFKDVLSRVLKDFWPYAKLRVLIFVKTFLWSLLLVFPGIYFTYRYQLAGVVFFTEGKRGNKAIKESLALTKNAWITTFASLGLLNLITLGSIQLLSSAGATSELYRNYRGTLDSKSAHPRPHWLSILFLVGFVLLIIASLVVVAIIIYGFNALTPDSIQTQTLSA